VFCQSIIEEFDDLKTFFSFFPNPAGFATQEVCQSEGSQSNRRRGILDKLPIEESNLHQESSNMLYFGFFHAGSTAHKPEPCFSSWMTESPLNCGEDMAFHLNEGGFFICVAADLNKVLHRRNTFFGILKFCSDPESCTADKLVMLDVDDATGNVAVNDIESEVQCLWTKTECEVNFNEEVDKTRAHVPSDFRLLIHRLSGGHGISLLWDHDVRD